MPRSFAHVPDLHAFARRLRERREEVGMSQRQLAFPGCTAAYISRLEAAARMPSRQMIDRLAERLGTTREWLETGVGPSDGSLTGTVAVAIPTAELNDEFSRWFARGDADAVTAWASLDDDEREQVLAAMRAAAVSVIGPMATAIAVNRQLRREALEALDRDLGNRLRAAREQAVEGEGVPC